MEIFPLLVLVVFLVFTAAVIAVIAFMVIVFLVTSALKIWHYPEDKFFVLCVLDDAGMPMTFHSIIDVGRKRFGYQGSIHRFREQIGRMEDSGYVTTFKQSDGQGDVDRGGRPWTFFEITDSGRAELNRLILDEVILEYVSE